MLLVEPFFAKEKLFMLVVKKSLVYLAAPYSDPDPAVRKRRFRQINKVASAFMREGIHIYSPISHSHPIVQAGGLPTGWDFWELCDRAVLSCCVLMVILRLPGWDQSTGVACETKISKEELGLHVLHVDYCDHYGCIPEDVAWVKSRWKLVMGEGEVLEDLKSVHLG